MSEATTRESIVGDRVPLTQVAEAFDFRSVSAVRKLLRELAIPYIVIRRQPYVSVAKFRAAIEQAEANKVPRGRGRPAGKKAA